MSFTALKLNLYNFKVGFQKLSLMDQHFSFNCPTKINLRTMALVLERQGTYGRCDVIVGIVGFGQVTFEKPVLSLFENNPFVIRVLYTFYVI